MRKTPAERNGFAKLSDAHPRVSVPALKQRAHLLDPLGPDDAKMTFAGNAKPGVRSRCEREHKCNSAAQAQGTQVAAVPHYHPARAGREGADPQCGAHRIDNEQDEDNPEATQRRAQQVGRIKPSPAIRQTRQQQRDAHAAFGKRKNERQRRNGQNDRHIVHRRDERQAQEDDHGADAGDGEPRGVAREFHANPLGRIALRLAVDLHRSARQPKHG